MMNLLLVASLALQSVPAAAAPTPDMAPPPPPAPGQVMAIPEELRDAFQARVLDATNSPQIRVTRMVEFMLEDDGLGLEYVADATNTVAESYRTRQVNCLSFTLMAVALARQAGLEAQGQEINRVMAWSMVGDVVMQALHANAVVTVKDRNLMVKEGRDYVLDIASNGLFRQDFIVHRYKVDDETLLASFYSNRAMELLAKGHLNEARAWLDVAMELTPSDAKLWNNAGVISQRMGDADQAESLFLRAAKQSPRLMSVLYNLVALYHDKGDATRATYWRRRADHLLRRDPYYQYSIGERSAESGDYEEAARYFRRAISLDSDQQLFHFSLAQAYFRLNQFDRAEAELKAAYKLSGESDRMRYRAKLDNLQAMRH